MAEQRERITPTTVTISKNIPRHPSYHYSPLERIFGKAGQVATPARAQLEPEKWTNLYSQRRICKNVLKKILILDFTIIVIPIYNCSKDKTFECVRMKLSLIVVLHILQGIEKK